MEKGNHGYKKGLWTEEEDKILMDYVKIHGKGHWNSISKRTGLKRCGKSCRLRWMNYLNPGIKRGHFSEEEQDLIIRLHRLLGNRWSLIAGRVPGRTDNQVKNYWNTHLSKKLGINKGPRKIAGGVTSTNTDGNNPDSDVEANKNSASSSDLDHTTSVHSDSHSERQSLSCAFAILPSTDSSSHQAPLDMDVPQVQHPTTTTTALSSDGYATNSSFWVSEFDGLMGDSGTTNPACFMELICGSSFNLDWDHL